MSDGMSDARALDDIARELQTATDAFLAALKRAEKGHRGLRIRIPDTVNEVLAGSGYELVDTNPGRIRW